MKKPFNIDSNETENFKKDFLGNADSLIQRILTARTSGKENKTDLFKPQRDIPQTTKSNFRYLNDRAPFQELMGSHDTEESSIVNFDASLIHKDSRPSDKLLEQRASLLSETVLDFSHEFDTEADNLDSL